MSFNNLQFLIPCIIFILIMSTLFVRSKTKFNQWVKDHWFYEASLASKLQTIFYVIALSLITLALLDLRGPEKRIKGNKQEQKTLILIDSSASMLAEDVRPTRFEKALLLVKHYSKKAVGQQLSLVVFSDSQKRIVPFTDDLELINARISSLENLDINRGGTGLTQALQESVQYFLSSSEEKVGNILVFTDAEETEGDFTLEIPDTITVGVVGIGTAKGAPIPLRNSKGVFRGNKKFNNEVVISKLDEKFIKSLGEKITNYKYWIATSYSLPTEEILSFFNRMSKKKMDENEYRVKPVLANYLLVPGITLLILSLLFGQMKSFTYLLLLFCFNSYAQNEKVKEPVKSPQTLLLEEKLKNSDLDVNGRKSLAARLLKEGFPEQSSILYDETLSDDLSLSDIESHSNDAISKVSSGQVQKGLLKSKKLLDLLKDAPEGEANTKLQQTLKKNILKALEQSGGGQSGENKEDNQENKGEDQNQKNSSQGEQKEKDNEKENKNDKKDKDKKGNEKKSDKDKKDKKNQSDKLSDSEKKKMPAILKQLINDDNQLQKKFIDAETVERKSNQKKDW